MEHIMHTSLWKDTTAIAKRAPLDRNIKTDVAIVGGGLAGILTAHFLEQAGRKAYVLEAEKNQKAGRPETRRQR